MGKSILDTVPAISSTGLPAFDSPPKRHLGVVSTCPKCGSPIYGERTILPGDSPSIQFSCTCKNPTSIEGTTRTS